MATFEQWVAGARPRTLFAAVAPVVIGTAAAAQHSEPGYAIAILAAVVSLALQIGVNYANDYSDGIRGTDDARVGPVRLVGQKLARPESVKAAAFLTFGFAAITGLALVAIAEAWWLLPLGAASIIAAWKYTGGDKPYGYRGLGEVFVFVFFGLVATLGTMYAQVGTLSWFGLAAAVGVGAIASAILVVNNLRDIPSDTESGKNTLAVRLGDKGTRRLWLGLILVSLHRPRRHGDLGHLGAARPARASWSSRAPSRSSWVARRVEASCPCSAPPANTNLRMPWPSSSASSSPAPSPDASLSRRTNGHAVRQVWPGYRPGLNVRAASGETHCMSNDPGR